MNLLALARQALAHPNEFFYDIQFEGRAKIRYALILIALAVVARLLALSLTGFTFQTREPYEISALIESCWIIVPWLTWTVTNWAVGAIIDGEGKFKDIVVSSAFAFTPYIALMIPIALVSKLFTESEAAVYITLNWFVYLWVALLIILQVKVVHDFELGKTLWISFLTLLGMFIIWFIALLLYGLIDQAVTFIISVFKEISFRI